MYSTLKYCKQVKTRIKVRSCERYDCHIINNSKDGYSKEVWISLYYFPFFVFLPLFRRGIFELPVIWMQAIGYILFHFEDSCGECNYSLAEYFSHASSTRLSWMCCKLLQRYMHYIIVSIYVHIHVDCAFN